MAHDSETILPDRAPARALGMLPPVEILQKMYYYMALSRAIDTRLWQLGRQGRAHFVITAAGHEAAQVGAAMAMRLGYDYFVPYYRDMSMCLAAGMTARDLLLHVRGAPEDPNSGGRQMFGHFSRRDLNIVSGSSSVGSQMLHAVGLALAFRNRGEDRVTITGFGEGAISEGDWHEAMSFAAIHKLGVIFFCENNGYAISVPAKMGIGTIGVADKAAAYDMPGIRIDGNDVLAVYETVSTARAQVAAGGGPVLIEAMTYRLTPHSNADDDSKYRSPEEVKAAWDKEPITRFCQWLKEKRVMSDAELQTVDTRIAQEVDEATEYAYSRPEPPEELLYRHVYASQGGA
jgi:2-oxoisovalerate dehydrogenase E1 component alpha subunit